MCVLTIKNDTVEDCGKYIFLKIFSGKAFLGPLLWQEGTRTSNISLVYFIVCGGLGSGLFLRVEVYSELRSKEGDLGVKTYLTILPTEEFQARRNLCCPLF